MDFGTNTSNVDANNINGLGNMDSNNFIGTNNVTDYYGENNDNSTMDEKPIDNSTIDVNQEQALNTDTAKNIASQDKSGDEQNLTVDDYESAWDNIDLNNVDIDNLSLQDRLDNEDDTQEPVIETGENIDANSDVIQSKKDFKPYKVKYKNREVIINSEEEATALMQKGLDYELKMSTIKPYEKSIEIIKKYNLTPDDIELFARAKAGDSDAISKLVSDDYVEHDDGKYDTTVNEVDSIKSDDENSKFFERLLQTDPELAGRAIKVYNEIDPTFKAELVEKGLLEPFVGSIATGEFDKVYPYAIKIKALNPALDWISAYQQAVKALQQNEQIETEPKEPVRVQRQKNTNVRSAIKQTNDYDSVWDANVPLEELEKQIFGG